MKTIFSVEYVEEIHGNKISEFDSLFRSSESNISLNAKFSAILKLADSVPFNYNKYYFI